MTKLNVFIPEKKQDYKPDGQTLFRALNRLEWKYAAVLEEISQVELAEQYPDIFRKILYLSVKLCGKMTTKFLDQSDPSILFQIFSGITEMFQHVTPRELLRMFPPAKRYDGKGEWKDYFTTMDSLSAFPLDKPFGEEDATLHLLMDYMNWDINLFMVNWMGAVSRMSMAQGGRDPLEEFLEERGVATYTYHEQEWYLYNRLTGKTVKVQKAKRRRPKYLRKVR